MTARDAKRLEDLTTKDLSFVSIFEAYFANKADAMKDWQLQVQSVPLE